MIKTILINDFKKNKFVTLVTGIFMALSAMLIAITIILFANLWNAIDSLTIVAKTPDFLQMHTGEVNESLIKDFNEGREDIDKYQICKFLNIDNTDIYIGGRSLSDNSQDNGLCTQSEDFDFLVDSSNNIISVNEGKIYVPICYKGEYEIEEGDKITIAGFDFMVEGFLRDSQMNSMMASSKRFLVNKEDYIKLRDKGTEEYLIEYKLSGDASKFQTDYMDAGLPNNGPTITLPLIRMMNVLSDGMMIMVIFMISIVITIIAVICIRYIVLAGITRDVREIGMLKAIGISRRDIKKMYLGKYSLLSISGSVLGFIIAVITSNYLATQMQELYGVFEHTGSAFVVAIIGIILIEGIILASIGATLHRIENMSAVNALRGIGRVYKRQYRNSNYLSIAVVVAAGIFLMLIPQNLASTIASPQFVSYMGIGDAKLRIDVRQNHEVVVTSNQIANYLDKDEQVADYVILYTSMCKAYLEDGTRANLITEIGDHGVFPVKYISGTYPESEEQIAISYINAEELGLKIGDVINISVDDNGVKECTVCGIYSDITNGGKTAKIYKPIEALKDIDADKIMWSIFYVSAAKDNMIAGIVDRYADSILSEFEGVKIYDINRYVMSTYGPTIEKILQAALVAKVVAGIIIFIVVSLFLRLIIEQARMDISLKKALGYTSKEVISEYIFRLLGYILGGIVCGIALGNILGQEIVAMALKSFGACDFTFIVSTSSVYFAIPLYTAIVAIVSACSALGRIKGVKAYECLAGRD